MKITRLLVVGARILGLPFAAVAATPRLLVLTDIGGDPDDQM